MSVIVKGMKMPESCYYCGFTDTSFINCLAFEKPILLEDDCEEKRPDWCPLVALPDKHGRLVDADALIRNHFSLEHRIALSEANKAWMRKIINDAPTIVESEGG